MRVQWNLQILGEDIMKKILSVLLALCLVLAAVPAAGIVVSADETFGDFTYGRMALSDEIEITGYNGSSAEITIPSKIGDEDVKAIGGNALKTIPPLPLWKFPPP